jgi:hypothetical protein
MIFLLPQKSRPFRSGVCYYSCDRLPGDSREPVSDKVFPLGEVSSMSKDEDRLPDKKEERDLLARVVNLAPLLALVLQLHELLLKICGVIN